MKEIYFYLFIGICSSILMWGMIRLERVYQYPFFMGAIFVSFILPQASALVNSSSYSLPSTAVEKVLLYSCMCASMCWTGYQFYRPKEKWLSKLDLNLDNHKLFKSAVLFLVVGNLCHFILSRINIQTANSGGTWTGPATILIFIAGVLNIALPIFLFVALRSPTVINITLTVLAAIPLLQAIILYGRRQPTMILLLIIGMSLFLVKKYIPPRWAFIIFVISAALIIPVLGALRGDFWSLLFKGDWETAWSATQKSLNVITKGEILELRNAAYMIDGADLTNTYGYGTGFWDSIVFQYVPGQIVGFDVKKSFQFGSSLNLREIYGYSAPTGSTTTGIGDSYAEFGYFGCLIFAAIGCMFKTLWFSIYRGSIFSALLYIGLISSAMVGITHGISRFLQEFIFQTGVMYLVAKYSQIPRISENKFKHRKLT
jgi:hypothetical protein